MWNLNRTTEESLVILRNIAKTCCNLGGPLTKSLYLMAEREDYRGLIDYKIDYTQWATNDLIYARQVQALFSKLEILPLGVEKEAVAYQGFIAAEQKCLETNARLRRGRPSGRVGSVLHMAQRKISSILGVLPLMDDVNFAFGPGANTGVKGSRAFPRGKLSVPLECSAEMATRVADFLFEVPEWVKLAATAESEDSYTANVDIVPGKLVFVPKNAKTKRSICVEPVLNSFFQKGIGSLIRERLASAGVDLTDQTVNQKLAMRASIADDLATVDLSMASDCLSKELVYDLLPLEWASLLGTLRTGKVRYGEDVIKLEKFSSMGNGYTFELESLIFYGIAYASARYDNQHLGDVSVYGDDIIIPRLAYDTLKEVLTYCGFELNSEKSYVEGPFRESCGADYYLGFDIRPFYQKTPVSDRTLYTMHNWFVRHCEVELAAAVIPHLRVTVAKLYGPDGYGDGHLIGDHGLRYPRKVTRRGWCGGYFDTYVLKHRSFDGLLPGDAVLPVYSVYTRSGANDPTDPNIIRGSNGYAKVSIYTLKTGIFNPA